MPCKRALTDVEKKHVLFFQWSVSACVSREAVFALSTSFSNVSSLLRSLPISTLFLISHPNSMYPLSSTQLVFYFFSHTFSFSPSHPLCHLKRTLNKGKKEKKTKGKVFCPWCSCVFPVPASTEAFALFQLTFFFSPRILRKGVHLTKHYLFS